jgi:hypothetical protein
VRRTPEGYETRRGRHGASGTWGSASIDEAVRWLLPGARQARTPLEGRGTLDYVTPDVNTVLKIYLGAGVHGGYQPIGLVGRFRRAFPHDHVERLAQIAKYLEQDHEPDWSVRSAAEEQIAFAARLAERFPELDSVAAHALACRWSYNNK